MLPPCSVKSHSLEWNKHQSYYSDRGHTWWAKNEIANKFTSCCKLFRTIFSYNNIDDIFKIMKFSIGLQLPRSIRAIAGMKSDEYHILLPNDGSLTALEGMGYV